MFSDHVHYQEYQRMLVELHALIAAGRNQSSDAQRLRVQMEVPEAHLSEKEIIRLNELSSDLSMTHEREIPDQEVSARVSRDELPLRIQTAIANHDWEVVLQLLRAGVSHLWKPAQIAYVRSRAYESLGEFAPAIAFMDEAAKRAPDNVNYSALAIRLLWEGNRFEEAYSRARDCLRNQNSNSRLVLMSGGIIARQSMQGILPFDFTAIAKVAVDRMTHALPIEKSPNLVFAGFVALGLLAVHLDNTTAATDAFDEALAVGTDEQITSNPTLNRELELLRSGKSKTAEERANARQLAEIFKPALALV